MDPPEDPWETCTSTQHFFGVLYEWILHLVVCRFSDDASCQLQAASLDYMCRDPTMAARCGGLGSLKVEHFIKTMCFKHVREGCKAKEKLVLNHPNGPPSHEFRAVQSLHL